MGHGSTGEAGAPVPTSGGISRRRFLAGATVAAAAAWTPLFTLREASAQSPAPPGFPPSVPLYRQAFRNWSGETVVDDLWTCAPTTPDDIVTVANWAAANSYRLRARGMGHGWAPLVVPPGSGAVPVVLVDARTHLTAVRIDRAGSPATVTAQTGVTMDDLLAQLETAGYGLTATPAPGDLTLGGVLAIDAHGSAVRARGETPIPGRTYGSLSNLVLSLTAVVWDPAQGRFALRTFARSDPAARSFLVHLGRTLVTEATLQVGTNSRLRCQSRVDIPAATLFAAPGSGGGQTFADFVESAGRVEAIWFPFTDTPWLKVWSVAPVMPAESREVDSPYNYVFSDTLPEQASKLISEIVAGDGSVTPAFGQAQLSAVRAGLASTATLDIWGWSKNLLLYIRPTTLRVTANGYAVLTTRANVQRVVSEFTAFYQARLLAYQAQGLYPVNGSAEIRVTGLDDPADVSVASAGTPQLSAARPRPDHPEWDVAVWLDILTIPGTASSDRFYRDVETWIFANYSGTYAAARVEWSKGWAYTDSAAWADQTMLTSTIPGTLRAGQPAGDNWDTAVAALDAGDPRRVFSNAFLDVLLP
jgi:FAD/FMN-containing dehydrogenase